MNIKCCERSRKNIKYTHAFRVVNVLKEMNKWACVNAKKGTKPKENKNQLAHTEQSDFLFHHF